MSLPIRIANSSNKQDKNEAWGALATQSHPSVVIDLTVRLPYGELAKLYRNIETALPDVSCRVVQFVSAYMEEGASNIAFETAVIAAQMMGKRVLIIDTSASQSNAASKLPDDVGLPLDTLLLSGRPPYEALAQAAGTELYFVRLHQREENGLPTASINIMEQALEHMRVLFDLIVIDSQAVLKDAFGISFAKLANGSILVVEAERARAPVIMETRRMLESGGGNIIGAVLNKRRFYIPRFIYRLLYPHNEI